jgi:hypothetical protein
VRRFLPCVLVLSQCVVMGAYAQPGVGPSHDVFTISRAVRELHTYLEDHPNSVEALLTLGSVHISAYALGKDAVALPLPEGDGPIGRMRTFIPPGIVYAKRLVTVPSPRARHLAEAVRAFQRAAAVAPDNNGAWMGLGYALHESRDRFAKPEWPLEGEPFDVDAKLHGGEAAFWEEKSLDALRNVCDEDRQAKPSNTEELKPGNNDCGGGKIRLCIRSSQPMGRHLV